MEWENDFEDNKFTSITPVGNFSKTWCKYKDYLTQNGFYMFCSDGTWYLKFVYKHNFYAFIRRREV